ncbi:spermidine synthase family protein [Actinomarinicola tropica]|uniref:Spermidine synthase n=1 Tax=Actinomarinicola tropica TaxID=2789776 RepID=A0A5Q2RMN8_9ACTN|nr:hypothetical protein [Actinomarinicola tropica]QGG95821.1 hypothetical protein GH723_12320 [Actinomarinicola tropica]
MTDVRGDATRRSYLPEILLVSFAALLMEIAYTRVISFKLFYYYTYLIIGLALLGTGCGGVLMAVSGRLRRAETGAIVMWSALVGAVSVLVGYVTVALTPIDTLAIWEYEAGPTLLNVARLLLICLALFAAFLPIGVVIALLLSRGSDEVGRLYFADLVGAGLACAIVVFLLNWAGPVTAIMLAGLVLAVVALRLAIGERSRLRPAAAGLVVVLGAAAVFPGVLPEPRTDSTKPYVNEGSVFSAWSALFRVDVSDPFGDFRWLYHDGLVGSAIHEFDGDLTTLTRYDSDERSLPFAAMEASPDDVLIVGAAGGNEILASLYFGSRHIDAVELNPVTYDLVTDRFADYVGNIADHESVNYVQGEGRSYLARSDKDYDLIWFPAPDSYSANASSVGAFVLSESYLYTQEAIEESLSHLTPDGLIAWHYGEFDFDEAPNRTARYIATAREALAEVGVDDPTDHFVVTTAPTVFGGASLSTVLIKATPFTDEEIDRVVEGLDAIDGGALRYAPGRTVDPNPIDEMLTTPEAELEAWFDGRSSDVRPITDDGPFFWHFHGFGDVVEDMGEPITREDKENAVGERVLLLLLVVAVVLASVFLLLPFLTIRQTWRALPRKASSAAYFACLGLGFIFFEIVLIQRLTLYLGYPTYSLTVTLASILVFTGVGAYLSGRIEPVRERVVPVLLAAIVLLTAFFQFGLGPLTDGTLDWPLAARLGLVFVLLAPLGMCLGMFMPLGIGAVARLTNHSNEYVAWGWAVNGFASVIGSVLSTILGMVFGFRIVMFISLGVYCIALAVLYSLLRPEPDPALGSDDPDEPLADELEPVGVG